MKVRVAAAGLPHLEKTALSVAISAVLYSAAAPALACSFDGQVISVDTAADLVDGGDGLTSLREALAIAESDPDCDRIEFAAALQGQLIVLNPDANGALIITQPLNVAGPGSGLLTIEQPDNAITDAAFTADAVDVSIAGLAFGGDGGGLAMIANAAPGPGILVLDDVVIDGVAGNNAVNFGAGGPGSRFSMSNSVVAGSGSVLVASAENIAISDTAALNNTSASGGAMSLTGTEISLERVIVSDNTATGSGGGLTINTLADASVSIADSTVSGNAATGAGATGGGVHLPSFTGDLSIVRSVISANRAGGAGNGIAILHVNNGNTVEISDSQIADNVKFDNGEGGAGGGIFVDNSGHDVPMTVRNSAITGNQSDNNGGGIYMRAGVPRLTIIDSTVSDNQITESGDGGGVYISANEGAIDLDIQGSTIAGNRETNPLNSGRLGGGIMVAGLGGAVVDTVAIVNSTISGNSTDESGGGIYLNVGAGSVTTIAHSTITGNTTDESGTPGIAGGGTVNLDHTVLAGNRSTVGDSNDMSGGTINLNYAFVGQSSLAPATVFASSAASTENGGDPPLGALADNGGPTPTHLPDLGGALIDTGNNALQAGVGDTPAADQRGSARVLGSAVDIGAVEFNRPPRLDTPIDAVTATVGEAFALDLSDFFSDPDLDLLSYSIANPAELPAAISIAGATVSATFADADIGSYTVRYQVCDAPGLCLAGSGELTVAAARTGGGGSNGLALGGGLAGLLAGLLGWRRARRPARLPDRS